MQADSFKLHYILFRGIKTEKENPVLRVYCKFDFLLLGGKRKINLAQYSSCRLRNHTNCC